MISIIVLPFFSIITGMWNRIVVNKSIIHLSLLVLRVWVFQYILLSNKILRGSIFIILCIRLLRIVFVFFVCRKSLTFYVFFELRLIPTLLMVFIFGYQPEKLQARIYLLMYTVFSSLPLLLIFIRNNLYLSFINHQFLIWYVFVMTFGFRVKTPLYLVHVWLPKAHVEAPVAGSIVLAGILLKLGSYGLIIFCPLFKNIILICYVYLSILGAIYCSLICLRNYDIKSLIAYRSVVHMGVVTVGVVIGNEIGYKCALIIVIAHGVCSPFLFSLAFFFYTSTHSRVISCNKGSVSVPIMVGLSFVLLAINIGVPPSINVWSEVFIFFALLDVMKFSVFFLLIVAFLGVVYNLFLYIRVSQRKESFFLKIDSVIWPFLNSVFLRFCLFLMVNLF